MATEPDTSRTALLAGSTGLIGRALLPLLLGSPHYGRVHALARRALSDAPAHAKLQWHTVDFQALPALPAIDDVYIALGTTIKVAGSQAAFRAIDLDAVLAVAAAGRAAGATRAGVVSAMGANARSSVFYNRVKGEMELALAGLGYASLVFARPSLLAGDRDSLGQPGRSGEKLALLAMRFGAWLPANYRAIDAGRVAGALHAAVRRGAPGVQVLLSGRMQDWRDPAQDT